MRKSPKFSPGVVERAVRMIYEAKDQCPSQWAATVSIAGKMGATPETLRCWIWQCERDSGLREGLSTLAQIDLRSSRIPRRCRRSALINSALDQHNSRSRRENVGALEHVSP